MRRAALLLAALLLVLPPVADPAGARERTAVLATQPAGLVESTIASCTGGAVIGAMIGVLVVFAGGFGAIAPAAGLFCGLSVAASVVTGAADHISRLVDQVLARHSPANPETPP